MSGDGTAGPGSGNGQGNGGAHAGGGHATVGTYVLIGLILTILTAVEVAVFYIPALSSVLIPILLVLSAAKFVLVVMFYMHLKYDHPVFRRVFFGPLVLGAVFVIIGLIVLFKFVPRFDVN
ncbi:MAG: cytochrome C oxidase subunit IV family protein [Gemmatimonadetes bacterium]|nr:cytochrome C oxidase subunit IV family protein [Gemmatimonadota bacterium]